MRRKWIVVLSGALALAALVAIPTFSSAERDRGGREFEANLEGFNEVPAVSTPGRGEAELRVNRDRTALEFEVKWRDVAATVAHIHLGQKDVNGGVIAFFCGGGGQEPCPTGTSATIRGTITAAHVIGPANQGIAAGEFGEVLEALSEGVVYANVHSAAFPGGEIRGQLR